MGSIMGVSFFNWLLGIGLPEEIFTFMVRVNCFACLVYFFVRIYLLAVQYLDYEKTSFWFIKTKPAKVEPTDGKKQKKD